VPQKAATFTIACMQPRPMIGTTSTVHSARMSFRYKTFNGQGHVNACCGWMNECTDCHCILGGRRCLLWLTYLWIFLLIAALEMLILNWKNSYSSSDRGHWLSRPCRRILASGAFTKSIEKVAIFIPMPMGMNGILTFVDCTHHSVVLSSFNCYCYI
jgi:hypothetical protein